MFVQGLAQLLTKGDLAERRFLLMAHPKEFACKVDRSHLISDVVEIDRDGRLLSMNNVLDSDLKVVLLLSFLLFRFLAIFTLINK